jgi:DUF3102 family protein
VQDAIAIGEFLTNTKASLGHGEWLPWIDANLEFSHDTANNYRRLYDNRHKLRSVRNITEAYRLLSSNDQEEPENYFLPG